MKNYFYTLATSLLIFFLLFSCNPEQGEGLLKDFDQVEKFADGEILKEF